MATASMMLHRKPGVVFREDPGAGGVLYDTETGKAFSLNATGALIWSLLDGKTERDTVLHQVGEKFDVTAGQAELDFEAFAATLVRKGLAGYVDES